MKLKVSCPYCKTPKDEVSRSSVGKYRIFKLLCGHTVTENIADISRIAQFVSKSGEEARKYQYEGIEFARKNGFRVLIGDEVGVGKTIQALGAITLYPNDMLPCAVLCKAGMKDQWFHEFVHWTPYIPQVIDSRRDKPQPDFFKVFIISVDSVKNLDWLKDLNIKSVIIDETQMIKSLHAKRTIAVQDFVRDKEHIMGLSATPIKNNAREYFPILNILDPRRFSTEKSYLNDHVQQIWTGYVMKYGGLVNPKEFFDLTKDLIIRRRKIDVLPELPSVNRMVRFVNFGPEFKKAYEKIYEEFEEYYDRIDGKVSSATGLHLLAFFARMRHQTGVAKIQPVVDYADEFLRGTDRKLAIFIHHKDVGHIINVKLQEVCKTLGIKSPLTLSSEMSTDKRADVVRDFAKDENRILIASSLASGEGLNLQFCSDALIVERQWNPANEEQIIGRFHRFGAKSSISITYFQVDETIDEFLAELNAHKKEYSDNTLDGIISPWDQDSFIRAMTDRMFSSRRKKWSYR
jgi:SNF2 family DNA or RNA helicase